MLATPSSSRRGRGSARATSTVSADPEELAFFLRYTDVPSFVQEMCIGEEFSIDVFSDMEGRCLNAIPRTMLLSKGGESIKGVSLKDQELIEHGARVAEAVGVKGPANVQCFREPDGSLPVTDVNTRFGGGFPVPLAAGGRYPELALALARGERPEPQPRRLRRGRRDDALLLRGLPRARRRRRSCRQHVAWRSRGEILKRALRDCGSRSPSSVAFGCATSSPAQPASSGRSSCGRSSSAGTTRPAWMRSRTTTTLR